MSIQMEKHALFLINHPLTDNSTLSSKQQYTRKLLNGRTDQPKEMSQPLHYNIKIFQDMSNHILYIDISILPHLVILGFLCP